jgi:hypothetical protein
MGKLLDIGIIQSSKASAGPTFTYQTIFMAGGTVSVYKNGTVIATITTDTGPISVSVVSGDTIRMLFVGTSIQAFDILYKLNGVTQNTYTYSGTGIDTGTKTLASSGAYNFTFEGAA